MLHIDGVHLDFVAMDPAQEMRQQQFSKMDAMRSSAIEDYTAPRSCTIESLSSEVLHCPLK